MSFINNPDIQDDGQGNVSIGGTHGTASSLNVKCGAVNIAGITTYASNIIGNWFSFNNMQSTAGYNVSFKDKNGANPVNVTISGELWASQDLTVNGNTALKTTEINSETSNLPLIIRGVGGGFAVYSSGGQDNGAVIRGGNNVNSYGLVFTGTDRVRMENLPNDNRLAIVQDIHDLKECLEAKINELTEMIKSKSRVKA